MTMQLLDEVRFDGFFAFKYSKRPKTAALTMSGHLPETLKETRLAEVLAFQKGMTIQKNATHVGEVHEILIDGISKKGGMISGRTRGNKVVNVPASPDLIGCFAKVRITSAGANSLIGQLCE